MDIEIKIVHSVEEVDPEDWDGLGDGIPFSSHQWYRFGEAVMKDCTPVYILLCKDGQTLARATFWVIRNEPLPISWTPLRNIIQGILKHWPLLICRSPIANTSALILPEGPLRKFALDKIIEAAKKEGKKYKASFLLFDYMNEAECNKNTWPTHFRSTSVPDPSTKMKITWTDFDQYFASLKPKVRKHYRQYNREVQELGIRIQQQDISPDREAALALIRNIELRHGSSPNPWARSLIENAYVMKAAWLTAWLKDRLIGCELILVDNGTQMVTALGMANEFPHIYFILGYEDIRYAIEHKVEYLNWGSGAFEAKHRLGFELQDDNQVLFCGIGWIPGIFTRLAIN
jgi:predicted N-acyltransferase